MRLLIGRRTISQPIEPQSCGLRTSLPIKARRSIAAIRLRRHDDDATDATPSMIHISRHRRNQSKPALRNTITEAKLSIDDVHFEICLQKGSKKIHSTLKHNNRRKAVANPQSSKHFKDQSKPTLRDTITEAKLSITHISRCMFAGEIKENPHFETQWRTLRRRSDCLCRKQRVRISRRLDASDGLDNLPLRLSSRKSRSHTDGPTHRLGRKRTSPSGLNSRTATRWQTNTAWRTDGQTKKGTDKRTNKRTDSPTDTVDKGRV